MAGSSAREPFSEPDDEEPAPAPDQYQRQSSAFDRVLPVPLRWSVGVLLAAFVMSRIVPCFGESDISNSAGDWTELSVS